MKTYEIKFEFFERNYVVDAMTDDEAMQQAILCLEEELENNLHGLVNNVTLTEKERDD